MIRQDAPDAFPSGYSGERPHVAFRPGAVVPLFPRRGFRRYNARESDKRNRAL